MSYVAKTLISGETIEFNGSYSKAFWITALFYFLVFSAIAAATGIVLFMVLGILVVLLIGIRQVSTEIAVTSRRVIYKRGLLFRRVKDIPLSKIELTEVEQGLMARISNYGSIKLHGSGVGLITLLSIQNPMQFKQALDGALERYGQRRPA
jgi:uncharacterized membrane protein YdbT with pleckstrin-like domain